MFLDIYSFPFLSFWFHLPVAQMVKSLPAERKVWAQSLGQEDSLEKENGNPLQYSCLENPMEREVWQAAVYVVAQSRI